MRELRRRLAIVAMLLATCALSPGADMAALEARANEGDVQAMITMGLCHRDGRDGAAKDEGKAVAWFRRAADKGSIQAYDHLGYMYLNGWGVPWNLAISTGWFRASAEAGWAQGRNNFAQSCFYGRGMKQDLPLAVAQWRAAAEDDHSRAAFWLGYCLTHGIGADRDEREAIGFLETAAKDDDPDAWWLLGEYYYTSAGDKRSSKAEDYWAKAKKHPSHGSLLTSADCASVKAGGAKAGERQFLSVPHIDQGWNLCGISATAIVLRYHGHEADPYTIKRNAPNSPLGTGTAWDTINLSLKKLYGFTWGLKTFSFDAEGAKEGLALIRKELDAGNPVLIDIRGADATGGAHTVTVVGYDRGAGQVYIQDTARFAPGVVVMTEAEFSQRWNSQGFITNATGEVLRPLLLTGNSRKR